MIDIPFDKAIELVKGGMPHGSCPDGWYDCNCARVVAEHLFDPTPLTLETLTAELGEPSSVDKTMTRHFVRWSVCGAMVIRNELVGRTLAVGLIIANLGQLRRLLSVIRENAAGGEGE